MNQNGQQVMPLEVNLNSCAIDVIPINQEGQSMKQVRITHMSGIPVTLVMLLTEEGAQSVAAQLTDRPPVPIFSEVPK